MSQKKTKKKQQTNKQTKKKKKKKKKYEGHPVNSEIFTDNISNQKYMYN